MTYQKFQHDIVSGLKEHFGSSASITIRPVRKNNNVILDGLAILEEGLNISPTIYLNPYYEAYRQGQNIPSLIADILTLYEKNRPTDSIDVRFYTDFHNIRDRILFKIIHYGKNEVLLTETPHFRYLDLAIVFYCLISTTPAGSATILIKNSHLAYWNITEDELFRCACENTPKLLPHILRPLSDVIDGFMNSSSQDTEINTHTSNCSVHDSRSNSECNIYVLTNRCKLYGASCILYPDILQDIAEKFKNSLYILPSSIHEVLLIPSTNNISPVELNRMVCEVNDSQVADDEILSDHIYYYSLSKRSLTMK